MEFSKFMAKSKETYKVKESEEPVVDSSDTPDTADPALDTAAEAAKKKEAGKGGELEYWKKEFGKVLGPAGSGLEGAKKVVKAIKNSPATMIEAAKATPGKVLEGAKATPRYAWEGTKGTVFKSSGVLLDTAWFTIKKSWKFLKKMGWGIITGHPPSASQMWEDMRKDDKDGNKSK